MGLRKGEIVVLESGGKQWEFDAQHAENILNATNNTGPGAWALPSGSPYQFDNGKLNRTPTATTDSSPEK